MALSVTRTEIDRWPHAIIGSALVVLLMFGFVVVGESNSNHYFVATQDPALRAKLRNVPGRCAKVAVVYGTSRLKCVIV